MTALTKKAKCKLTVCPLEENKEDKWMQVCVPVGWVGWSAQMNVPELKSSWGTQLQGAPPRAVLATLFWTGRELRAAEDPCMREPRQMPQLTFTAGCCLSTMVTGVKATFPL